jgi:branched-chain amino acid transport system substrate-binding protein
MKRFILVLGLVAMVATLAVIPGAFGRSQADGINSRTITIGTTLPLSGPASLYARIGTGMKAYFSYINARKAKSDGKRGVYGRQILLNVYDDQYSEAQTIVQTRKAVEQDKVFAMLGGLGTENQQAVRDYLNDRKVPQLYVSTGLSQFGTTYKEHPWTIGWQPDYIQEGILMGRYAKQNLQSGKFAVLYQNDDYGKEWLYGFQKTVGASNVVASQSYPRGGGAAAISAPVARLRASGANALVVIATPTESITALVVAYRLGWRPDKLVNSVGATDAFMKSAQNSAGSPDAVNGVVSTGYLKDPSDPSYANDPQVKLYKQIMAKYAPSFPEPRDDTLFFYGMAKADTFVQALYRAGKNPTRQSVMNAAANLKIKNFPWLLKGAQLRTSPGSAFPIRYQKLRRYTNGHFTEFGDLVLTRR